MTANHVGWAIFTLVSLFGLFKAIKADVEQRRINKNTKAFLKKIEDKKKGL